MKDMERAPQPSGTMKIVTTCERIQPVVVGTDERGEPIWEGRAHWFGQGIRAEHSRQFQAEG